MQEQHSKEHTTGLGLLKPQTLEPPAHLVEELLDHLVGWDLHGFATNLEIARALWRRFREMVEAPKFPEQLLPVYMEEGYDPDNGTNLNLCEECLDPNFRETQRPHVIEILRWRMERERTENEAKEPKLLAGSPHSLVCSSH
jgi:hypothetical protein